ncbi:hypothetical protein DFH11DRAFT_1733528 [Phellopilus nigrolimitatus]|nr:hypothetical protein DFH11DRAFT_1733528 [Phellopilus nigrolimitatus]
MSRTILWRASYSSSEDLAHNERDAERGEITYLTRQPRSALSTSRPIPNGAMVVAQALFFQAPSLAVPYEDKIARVDSARASSHNKCRASSWCRMYLPPPRSVSDPLISPTPDAVLRALSSTIILTAAYDYLAHEADEFAAQLRGDVGRGFDGIPTSDHHQRMLNSQACDETCGMVAQIVRGTLL